MVLKIFGNALYRHYVKRDVARQYMRDVCVEKVEKGIIVNEHIHGFGVFDKNHKFIESSRQVRKNNGQFVPKYSRENIPFVDRDAIFIGNVYPQFGHFLLEHMNRAWVLADKKYKEMLVVLINNQNVNPVPEYMYKFLELMGIPRQNILILNQTTQFRNVFIPSQGFNIPLYSSHEFGKTFDVIAENINCDSNEEYYEKIYMSRDALKKRRTYGEKFISGIF